jgi:hypothetical protein
MLLCQCDGNYLFILINTNKHTHLELRYIEIEHILRLKLI